MVDEWWMIAGINEGLNGDGTSKREGRWLPS